jgi:metal-responsive CopG/Arc/MetJ family transcriptional regulator
MKKKKAISVTIPYEITEKLEKISKREYKTISSLISEAVQAYCLKKEFEEIREDFSEQARKKGIITEQDINRVIHEFRKEKAKNRN